MVFPDETRRTPYFVASITLSEFIRNYKYFYGGQSKFIAGNIVTICPPGMQIAVDDEIDDKTFDREELDRMLARDIYVAGCISYNTDMDKYAEHAGSFMYKTQFKTESKIDKKNALNKGSRSLLLPSSVVEIEGSARAD